VPSDDSDAPRLVARVPPAPWKYYEKCSNDHVAAACARLGRVAAGEAAAAESPPPDCAACAPATAAATTTTAVARSAGVVCVKRVLEEACV